MLPDLLVQYGRRLQTIDDDTVELVGLVRFPRSPTLPLRHAAVLMSYLTFMFEIAETRDHPAWGVTCSDAQNIASIWSMPEWDLPFAVVSHQRTFYRLPCTSHCRRCLLLQLP